MPKITGGAKAINRIKRMGGAEAALEIGMALFAAGDLVATEAQISITRGSVSGRNHVPSKPGESPNNDSGVLANNVEVIQERTLKVVVSSNAPYSIPLEFGTSKLAARPFMRPAAAKHRKKVAKMVANAIDRVNNR